MYVVEDPLYFAQYDFHKLKLMLHRAAMQRFAESLRQAGTSVRYVEASELPNTGSIADILAQDGVTAVRYVDPCDDWLGRRLATGLAAHGISQSILDDPAFLTPRAIIDEFGASGQKLFFTNFYIAQRKRLGLLLDGTGPVGGKWSFDTENRKRLPKNLLPPKVAFAPEHAAVREARSYVQRAFPRALGEDVEFGYPTSPEEARAVLADFVQHRLPLFGDYEDAISQQHDVLFHSLLTPPLNAGLITPAEVVQAAMSAEGVPLNSREGFVRQVIGWREFMRLAYMTRGRKQRTRNFWEFTNPMPAGFYDGTTGIAPVDAVIRRVLRTGYCHHIERLMIVGNFLLLCEVAPDAVYQWYMELFVDAYDWVMVPNVYGMSQYADGGGMTTKPYISGSAYVLRMSDFPRGPWCDVWDALYWRFIDRQADFFGANPRMSMMVKMRDRLGDKMLVHRRVADQFLSGLHRG